jgi:hypothetical protein
MPMFYFSERDAYDADDGLEFSTASEACRQAEIALRAIAAETAVGSSELTMTVWDDDDKVVCRLRLLVEVASYRV